MKAVFRFGAPGLKRSGYEAGRLARLKALRKSLAKAQRLVERCDDPTEYAEACLKLGRATENLDKFLAEEAERKAHAREGA